MNTNINQLGWLVSRSKFESGNFEKEIYGVTVIHICPARYYTDDCTFISSWGRSVSIVSDCVLYDRGLIPGRDKRIFPLASVSRPALRSTQPPIQWVPVVMEGRGVTLTTHPHLESMSRMTKSYISSPP
jgi:hypothetical protein